MFIAALFIIAKTWKQTRCPSVGELVKQTVVHPHNRILLNAKKQTNKQTKIYQAMKRHGENVNAYY